MLLFKKQANDRNGNAAKNKKKTLEDGISIEQNLQQECKHK